MGYSCIARARERLYCTPLHNEFVVFHLPAFNGMIMILSPHRRSPRQCRHTVAIIAEERRLPLLLPKYGADGEAESRRMTARGLFQLLMMAALDYKIVDNGCGKYRTA